VNKYLAFIEAHPEGVRLIAIPIIFAVVNFFTKPRTPEEYMKLPPRLANLMKMLRGLFPDPQQTAEGLIGVIFGKVLSPDAKRASLNPPAIIKDKEQE
jgi:hypothetical protein